LTLTDAKIGEKVRRAGLYLLYHKAPFVQPLLSMAIAAKATEVVLPMTGRQFGDAIHDSCLIDLGLYAQHV